MAIKLVYCFLQVTEATSFLTRMHPLKHVAPVRKSQVQHAISEMLTGILKRLIMDSAPRWAGCCSTSHFQNRFEIAKYSELKRNAGVLGPVSIWPAGTELTGA